MWQLTHWSPLEPGEWRLCSLPWLGWQLWQAPLPSAPLPSWSSRVPPCMRWQDVHAWPLTSPLPSFTWAVVTAPGLGQGVAPLPVK